MCPEGARRTVIGPASIPSTAPRPHRLHRWPQSARRAGCARRRSSSPLLRRPCRPYWSRTRLPVSFHQEPVEGCRGATETLRRVAEVHVGAGEPGCPRHRRGAPSARYSKLRMWLAVSHFYRPPARVETAYQPTVAHPRPPWSVPPCSGLSRRYASTPSSKFRPSLSSRPTP